MAARFKSAYRDRLEAIQRVLDEKGKITGPIPPSGNQVQDQYCLTLTGSGVAILENIATPFMRTARRDIFAKARAKLAAQRDSRKQRHVIPHADAIP